MPRRAPAFFSFLSPLLLHNEGAAAGRLEVVHELFELALAPVVELLDLLTF